MTEGHPALPVGPERSDRLECRLRSAEGLLLGVDFDGTLAPIEEDPDLPTMDDAVERTVRTLADREDVCVAVVSGRELTDLRDRVGLDGLVYAGNHGLERFRDGDREVAGPEEGYRSSVRAVLDCVRSEVASIPGCHVEDKGVTASIHVRRAPEERIEDVRTAIDEAVTDRAGVRATVGKCVFEIRPAVDHDKGTTMRSLVREAPSNWLAVYLGDDTTDEDAFEAVQPGGVGVRVGTGEETAAAYRLPDRTDVRPFLEWLTEESDTGTR